MAQKKRETKKILMQVFSNIFHVTRRDVLAELLSADKHTSAAYTQPRASSKGQN